MYDFYKNPPKNKADLREWLVSWLTKPDPEPEPIHINGETFIQELGFSRAFHLHGVFRSLSTNQYVWWVLPSEEAGNLGSFPGDRYPDFETMLTHVIDEYYVRWKLTE